MPTLSMPMQFRDPRTIWASQIGGFCTYIFLHADSMLKDFPRKTRANGVQISELKPRHIYAHPEYAYAISGLSAHLGPPNRGVLYLYISLCRFNA